MSTQTILMKFALTIPIMVLTLMLSSGEAQAQSSDKSNTITTVSNSSLNNVNPSSFTVPTSQTQQIEQQIQKDSQEFLGQVKNPIDKVSGAIAKITTQLDQMLQSFVGSLKIPDLQEVVAKIMNGNFTDNEGTKLSATLENKPQGSYSIQSDLANLAQQQTATSTASDATLSKAAQDRQAQMAQMVDQNVTKNIQLGEESQNQDVTQHIMRNISQQTALTAQNQGVIILQNQQAQIDRALANTLSAQQAKELSELNITQRRQDAAAGTASSTQAGLFQMPGGITLGEKE
ncbi:hypothetical protein [Argonema antarcticum]|uniref:hypothetical protein n=1 Tax=Argonema antarcticum TaxID=2942763 RepID=UPI002011B5B9|nr:hypothetical protein [Argonema antarcticum]MCL1474789.1 hypothetical protein [Argonema antarcticum A004/B2]